MTSIKSIDAEVVEAFSFRSEEWLVEAVEHLQRRNLSTNLELDEAPHVLYRVHV